ALAPPRFCSYRQSARPTNQPEEEKLEINRSGSRPSLKGPAETFTRSGKIDPLFDPPAPPPTFCALGAVAPRARTPRPTPPLGQTLIVTSGCGWTQCWGEPKEEIRPGDVVWCPPGVKHWHGATATTAMSHIAIVEKLDGRAVDWMEKVSDQQYGAGSGAR